MKGNVRIYPGTVYRSFDYAKVRATGLEFDGLTLGVGLYDDAEKVAAIDKLRHELMLLRDAAMERIEDAAMGAVPA